MSRTHAARRVSRHDLSQAPSGEQRVSLAHDKQRRRPLAPDRPHA
ncbi:hypothetical protein EDWATA_02356 [Edwardsiella tarda ATCC 23685]|uniref:Uncharacterized protein n=1 Tax=Edwardsiella tarda ATCC 23685 TaxID=500638 RepID=D4F6H5_EDWTA|nr:hypothetical protein EDWATA_02356 [Edwardsiella tarda ATCC 23685]